MRLVHYSAKPLGKIRSTTQIEELATWKPLGLWVSDDDCEHNWRRWCEGEGYGLDSLACVHDVTLRPDAKIIRLSSEIEIDAFHDQYKTDLRPGLGVRYVDWRPVAAAAQGIIITPYCWGRRLSNEISWYYPWDCASGCIWDANAIQSVTLRQPEPATEAA